MIKLTKLASQMKQKVTIKEKCANKILDNIPGNIMPSAIKPLANAYHVKAYRLSVETLSNTHIYALLAKPKLACATIIMTGA